MCMQEDHASTASHKGKKNQPFPWPPGTQLSRPPRALHGTSQPNCPWSPKPASHWSV
ncbi:hypothetical protein M406DRAFT_55047, partial [Cryphonectria parasitica EP155]